MASIRCPSCGTGYQVASPTAGMVIPCKCGVRFDATSGIAVGAPAGTSPSKGKVTPPPAPTLPPSSPPSSRARARSIVGLLVLVVLAVGAMWLTQSGRIRDRVVASITGNPNANYKSIIERYLRDNLNDPTDLEFVEWETPTEVLIYEPPEARGRPTYESIQASVNGVAPRASSELLVPLLPGTLVDAKYRSKSPLGGKIIHRTRFLVNRGVVSGTTQWEPAGFQWYPELANYVAKRTADKQEYAVVVITFRSRGNSVELPFGYPQEQFIVGLRNAATGRREEDVIALPPYAQGLRIRPGQYIVTVVWNRGDGVGRRDLYRGGFSGENSPLRIVVTDSSPIQRFTIDLPSVDAGQP